MTKLVANVGQYPSKVAVGESYTFKQALVYTKSATDIKQITLVFNVSIKSVLTSLDETAGLINASISPNPSNESFKVELTRPSDIDVISMDGQVVMSFRNVSSTVFGEELKAGVYMVKAGNSFYKIIKQ